ncbi:hypothetical protein LCGC14_0607270 [marine sediment metagenome]|uniref:Uncharacterized protein n=1 Tax=marine sediment metagenome TaxID=412755 RepID=A0A0F9TUY2_9ZZZZ
MPKKGPQGNKDQLMIALELSHGLTVKEVSAKLGKPISTVSGIQGEIKKGWKPDLSETAIADASPSPGKTLPGGGQSSLTHSEDPPPDKPPGGDKKKEEHAAPGYISLAAIQIRSQYTPIMYMGRLASVDKFGWPADMSFEDLTDLIYYHFFKDRGVTLQGYIVDDEVDKPDNGKIEALQETVNKLVKLVEAGTEKKVETGEKQ